MAKVVNPLMSGEARGKLGGIIYNAWRGISTVKIFKSPAQPRTSAQLLARSRLTTEVSAWKSLTAARRTAWNIFAADHLLPDWTGTPKRITGQNWYIKCSVTAIRAGGTAIADPPTVSAPAGIEGFALSVVGADIKIAWTAPVTAGLVLETRSAGPHSAGIIGRYEQSTYKVMIDADAVSPQVAVAAAGLGTHTVWARSIDPATGLVSQWVSSSILKT